MLHASSAETASGQSGALYLPDFVYGTIELNVTVVSGTTPTLNVKLQTSQDGVNFADLSIAENPAAGDARNALAFSQATVVTRETIRVKGYLGPYIRIAWAIGGTTPSFTFTVTATFRS